MTSWLITGVAERRRLATALADWHRPNAPRDIAEAILKKIPGPNRAPGVPPGQRSIPSETNLPAHEPSEAVFLQPRISS